MAIDIAKLCADFLKTTVNSQLKNEKLSSSHAHELVSAFFGYQSKIALLAEKKFTLNRLDKAEFYFPDIPLMDRRRVKMNGLPKELPSSETLARNIAEFIGKTFEFSTEFKIYSSLKDYILDELIPQNEGDIYHDLGDAMSATNAYFDDEPYFDKVEFIDEGEKLIALVSGKMTGKQDEDKRYIGHELIINVEFTFYRVAGVFGFDVYDIETTAGVDWDTDERDPDDRETFLVDADIEDLDIKEISLENNIAKRADKNTPTVFDALQRMQDMMKPFVEVAQRLQVTTNLFVQTPGFKSFVDQHELMRKQFATFSINLGWSLRPYLESAGFNTALQNMAMFSQSMKLPPGLGVTPIPPMAFPWFLPLLENKVLSDKNQLAPLVFEQVKGLGMKKPIGFNR